MEIEKLCDEIEKVFPKFFDDFKNWEYANGKDAGKDFKRILNRAKKIKQSIKKSNGNTTKTTINRIS